MNLEIVISFLEMRLLSNAKYNVRYIAINDHFDTIDPNNTDSDIAGVKKLF